MIEEVKGYIVQAIATAPHPVVLEAGACDGTDTLILLDMLRASGRPYTFYCFEPDPRLAHSLVPKAGANFIPKAVGAVDGRVPFYAARGLAQESYYGSSSIRPPAALCAHYWPNLAFTESTCDCVRLDTFAAEHQIDHVDFLWADVQGAEVDLVEGGSATLRNTRFFFTEIMDEVYKGQIDRAGLLERVPWFKIIHDFSSDILLKNTLMP